MMNLCADALASLGENVTAAVPVGELQQLARGGDVTRFGLATAFHMRRCVVLLADCCTCSRQSAAQCFQFTPPDTRTGTLFNGVRRHRFDAHSRLVGLRNSVQLVRAA
jgi:hypothetical protein